MQFKALKTILRPAVLCPAVLLAAGIATSTPSLADTSKFSVGASFGLTRTSIDIPLPAGVSFSTDDQQAIGLSLGYAVSDTFSVEVDMVKGSTDINASGPGGTVGGAIDIDTLALYATTRSEGDVFFKFKFGYIKEDLSGNGPDVSDSGLSYGIGGGYKINSNASIEAEYVKVEADVAWILLSARYWFGN